MRMRWLSACVGIPLLVGVCWWGVVPFAVAMTVLALFAASELLVVLKRAGTRPSLLIAHLGLLGPALPLVAVPGYALTALPRSVLLSVVGGLFFVALLCEVLRVHRQASPSLVRDVGGGLFCGSYIALFGMLSLLRMPAWLWSYPIVPGLDRGFALVMVLLCCVWATDTAAFFVGRALGKTKLSPGLSPGKTQEGAIAGLALAVIVGAVAGHLLLGRALLGWWIGAIAGTAGQAGDLFESAVKRELGVKDMGGVIPGHGGVLDRFDSLLFAAAGVWLLVVAVGR